LPKNIIFIYVAKKRTGTVDLYFDPIPDSTPTPGSSITAPSEVINTPAPSEVIEDPEKTPEPGGDKDQVSEELEQLKEKTQQLEKSLVEQEKKVTLLQSIAPKLTDFLTRLFRFK
jgi:hypothetical protein